MVMAGEERGPGSKAGRILFQYVPATSDDAQLHGGRADLARARIRATAIRRRRRDRPPVPPRLTLGGPHPTEPRPHTRTRPEPGGHRPEVAGARQGGRRGETPPPGATNEDPLS